MIRKLAFMMVVLGMALVGTPVPPAAAALPYCYTTCPYYGGAGDDIDCWCLNRSATSCGVYATQQC